MQAQTEPLRDSVSHFKILERLGRGGSGVVYRAVDLRLLRTVALKFLAPDRGASEEDRRRFLREARAASALDHPNICTLYEIGEAADGRLFLAMAFCEGETLARRIERGPLPFRLVVDLALEVAAGLAAAHEKGIVHRDVKPGNLIVAPDGRLKIVDFGIARRADQTQLTDVGLALGTTVYMSPEQLRGEEVDRRTDLWSLGVVLYEMVTGDIPWDGGEMEVVASILQRTPRPLGALRPGVPPALEQIVARLLAKPRGQRYASAGELAAALLSVQLPAEVAAAELEETLIEIAPTPARTAGVSLAAAGWPAEEALPAGLLSGSMVAHFRIVAPLGGGGMGVVYQAEDTRLGRTVALKFLAPERTRDPAAKERFLQEARAASALDHPNLCTVHEVGETVAERLFLAMPCYDGETLARRIERGPLGLAEAVELACQAARGLAKAHRGGIVHRDIKPANLMVTGDGVVKILDFGIAELVHAANAANALSAAEEVGGGGSLAGTPAYMSPEQTRGEPVGPATDVWSLGVVLYEMLAGSRPFGGGSAAAVFHAIRAVEPEPLARRRPDRPKMSVRAPFGPAGRLLRALRAASRRSSEPKGARTDIPPELSRIVRKMLAKDPAERYPTAVEAFADLDSVRSGLTTRTQARPSPPARERVGTVAWLLLALAAGLGLWLWQRGAGEHPEPIQAQFRPLTDQEGRETDPSLSPDGRLFAYAKPVAGRSHLFLQPVAGGAPVDLSPASPAVSPADDGEPAFSPDGRRIAFRSERSGGGIFLLDLASRASRRLSDFGYRPEWSPDGREILCASEPVTNPARRNLSSRIFRLDARTGERRTVETAGDAVQPSFSPHGLRIAFWGVPQGRAERVIWTLPAGGGRAVPVIGDDHLNWDPVWSPDGRYLYFASDRGGSMNLWRVPIDEASGATRGKPEPVTTPASWSAGLSFSRDGQKLLYATDEGRSNLERVAFDPEAARITGPLLPVTQGSRAIRSGLVSPDGRFLVFDTFSPQEDLFLVRPDGSGLRQLTHDRFKDRGPRWSPDGSRIVFYSDRGGKYELWALRPDGGGLEVVARVPGQPLYNPAWSPDGRRLACLLGFGGTVLFDLTRPFVDRKPERLPAEKGEAFYVDSWAQDGDHLVGYVAGRGLALYSIRTGAIERLTPRGTQPVLLPDGRRLLFLDQGKLFFLDPAGGREPRPVLVPAPSSSLLSVSLAPDGRTLYLVRAVDEGDIWMATLR